MKVFISWSKARSKEVAATLRGWLPKVIQSCDPWMSAADIDAGQRWSVEIENELDASAIGIICVTPENQLEPWLNFEAGAISKKLGKQGMTRVAPYLLSMKTEDLRQPLGQFQSKVADHDGTLELVRMINGAQERALSDSVLKDTFERWWPDLEAKLKEIAEKKHPAPPPKRTSDEKIDELLDLARTISRRLDAPRVLPALPKALSSLLGKQEQPSVLWQEGLFGEAELPEDDNSLYQQALIEALRKGPKKKDE